jgi:hypothetical protein
VQIPTIFSVGGKLIKPTIKCAWGSDVKHTAMHTVQPLVPMLCSSEVHISIEKLKWCTLKGVDQILAELSEQAINHCVLRFTNLIILLE